MPLKIASEFTISIFLRISQQPLFNFPFLFPGITVPFVDYGKLQQAIEAALESMNLQKVPSFITKVIQVHETQLVRHGMMVVGEAGAGKSRNMEVLAKAL